VAERQLAALVTRAAGPFLDQRVVPDYGAET